MADKNIQEGDKVSWKWGQGKPSGTVAETADEGELAIRSNKGNRIKKNASPENPAVHVTRSGNDVVKRASELEKEGEGEAGAAESGAAGGADDGKKEAEESDAKEADAEKPAETSAEEPTEKPAEKDTATAGAKKRGSNKRDRDAAAAKDEIGRAHV